jgi:glycogen operon protein
MRRRFPGPYASINFITAHDGYTLQDLVSYEHKHNQANGEKNRDGESNNLSWNCGAEGATDNPDILALRARQKRNFLATLFLSQGVPMLLSGDEMGRSQQGNNNAYCQDNEISWLNWQLQPEDEELLAFVQFMIGVRKAHPVFRRSSFFQDQRLRGKVKNIMWLNPDGLEMGDDEWDLGFARCFGMYLAGDAIGEVDQLGNPVVDDDVLLMLNALAEEIPFTVPGFRARWLTLVDMSFPMGLVHIKR